MDRDRPEDTHGEVAFLRRVLMVVAILALVMLLWQAHQALLMVFAGVVVAVLLRAASRPLERHVGLSRGLALAAVGAATGGLLGLAVLLVGNEVLTQVATLWQQLPEALTALEQRFDIEIPSLGQVATQGGGEASSNGVDISMLGNLAGRAATLGTMVADMATALVVVVVGGFFLAADPAMYRNGLVKLLPRRQQARARDAMLVSGRALQFWLASQMISMALIGTMAGLGTWMLGLPSPLALGLFAGLMGFIPLLGAVAGAVPALLLALTEGSTTVLWTALLFIGVQQVESNMILPLVQKSLVSMPPALLLFAVVGIGMIFGLPGVLLAAPITVVAFVLVKKLYVRETLGQETEVPGEEQ